MSQQKTLQHVSRHVHNGYAPKKGARALKIGIDFSIYNPYTFDAFIAQETDQIEFVQAIYADNSANPNPFSLTIGDSNQVLTWPAYSQGYLPCLCPNPPRFSASTTGTPTVNIHLLTFPVPAFLWAASNSSGAVTGTSTYSAQGGIGNALLTNAAVAIKNAAGSLCGVDFFNGGVANTYVQIFDALAASVVLGTTVPKLSFVVPAGGWSGNIFPNDSQITFSTGIAVAATTTANGAVAPATGIEANILYK